MLRKRIIVCLDVAEGRVVKGTSFRDLRDMGDPVELAQRYQSEGADEIVFLDISAATEARRTLLDVVSRTADRLFIPLTVGGGINEVSHRILHAGGDHKVLGLFLLQHQPLHLDIVAGMAPVTFGVEISERQVIRKAELDARHPIRDFPRYKLQATARRLVIEEDS